MFLLLAFTVTAQFSAMIKTHDQESATVGITLNLSSSVKLQLHPTQQIK
jgi:hypothetical protein